ncbi:hypothetical protein [Nitrospira sp. Nam74]
MPDVRYKGYTIKVSSAIQHADGGWEALAMVWSKDMTAAYPIVTGELQVTEARAKAVALERAKAWVDASEEGEGR